jgi:hypothetical protein
VKKSVVMKTMTLEEISPRERCFMFALFPHLWERTAKAR